ncbi:MerR family transcriptional regulator [Georgenia sp. MJ173]|uniref:DNA polymerase III subunit beta family protein n=1 Tax=Georgenia sunbinii TaxID=3117728 RepID=UPI002F26264D
MDNLLSIGEVARGSGLSLSALRFYDRAGLLPPSHVDATTGYRWYSPGQLDAARLVASLRRVGLPVAEISTILAHDDAATASSVLDAHVRRLEDGLAAARGAIAAVQHRWQASSTLAVPATDLAAALDRVRYAAGDEHSLPELRAVLLESDGERLRLWATDRYRLATETLTLGSPSSPVRLSLSTDVLDDLRPRLTAGTLTLHRTGDEVVVDLDGRRLGTTTVGRDFPDVTHVIRQPGGRGAVVDHVALAGRLQDAPAVEHWLLTIADDGAVELLAATDPLVAAAGEDDDTTLLLSAEFLQQALGATGPGQLRLSADGPIAPLAISRADAGEPFSVIMPIRPDAR